MSVEALQLYHEKNAYLRQLYKAVEPLDFYRAIFPVGSFERAGHPEDAKPNGILLDLSEEKPRQRIVTDELGEIEDIQGAQFAVMSPISYSGRCRKGRNARYMYALTFDLDGVGMNQLRDVLHQMRKEFIPTATYIVNSGNGLHLYYVFKEPLPMYPQARAAMRGMKYDLTEWRIWNQYTSAIKEPQMQSIMQGFRMVGTQSKLGADCPVVAFEVGERIDIDYLNSWTHEGFQINSANIGAKPSLQEAKEKYPEWYQRRIVEGKKKGQWVVSRKLYDWWMRRIQVEIRVGHRYYAIMCLAIYAKKCGIPKDELEQDAFSLLERLDSISETDENRFTEDDIRAALKAYTDDAPTFPRDEIGKLAGVDMPVNKRNGLRQRDHIEIMNAIKAVKKKQGNMKPEGRPSVKRQIWRYLYEHPEERNKSKIARDLGIHRDSVGKWYDIVMEELRQMPKSAAPKWIPGGDR